MEGILPEADSHPAAVGDLRNLAAVGSLPGRGRRVLPEEDILRRNRPAVEGLRTGLAEVVVRHIGLAGELRTVQVGEHRR